jgi:hypothetical protein
VEAREDSSFFIAALPADTAGLHAAPVHTDVFLGYAALLGTPPLLGDGMRLVVPARRHELWHDEFPAGIGFSGHSLGEAEIASQRQRVLWACKHILMRFCRRTSAAAIAGMARK